MTRTSTLATVSPLPPRIGPPMTPNTYANSTPRQIWSRSVDHTCCDLFIGSVATRRLGLWPECRPNLPGRHMSTASSMARSPTALETVGTERE
jgi:hypothetical protein